MQYLSLIEDLIKPIEKNFKFEGNITIEDALGHNLEVVFEKCSIKIESIKYPFHNEDASWKFVCIALSVLEDLKEFLNSAVDDKDKLISISQRKTIGACMEFIVSLGLLPYLLPGVGIPIESRIQHANQLKHLQSLEPLEKYRRLCLVIKSLLYLKEEFIFHTILIPGLLNDILATLLQLSYAPLKKPSEGTSPSNSSEIMTPKLWTTLQIEKLEFKQILESIISNSYQPLLIRGIMVIQGNKLCPKWLKMTCSKILAERLMQDGGICATTFAVCETDYDSPQVWNKLDIVSRIIVNPHLSSPSEYFAKIIPQLLTILSSSDKKNSDLALKQVAARCVKLLSEDKDSSGKENMFRIIMKPFLEPSESIAEIEIDSCIQNLLVCCTLSSNEMFRVSPLSMTPIIYRLYLLLIKLNSSPLLLKCNVKELIYSFICDVPKDATFSNTLLMFMYNDPSFCKGVLKLSGFKYKFGSNGGICFEKGNEEIFFEEANNTFIELLFEKDPERTILNALFMELLTLVTDENPILNDFEKNLLTVKVLSILANDSKIQKTINNNPRSIVHFIKSLLNKNMMKSDVETLCLGLMILDVILSSVEFSEAQTSKDMLYFEDLVQPLIKTLESSQNEEVRHLVEKIINSIDSQTKKMKTTKKHESSKELLPRSKQGKKIITFEEALHDVCDPLLPVRAHALMQLKKCIIAKDKQALAKKDLLLCIFQENMKHEDSYLYLSAVEGLACLAAELPDSVLSSLINEYSTNDNPEQKLKVGEVLLKSTRILCDLVPTYKVELLNAFLSGSRDLDPLVRASSLSNLGEICTLLGFRVGFIIIEILECVRSIIATDKDSEPRRAAVMLITLLLKGLQKDTFNVLETQLLEVYRSLKQIYVLEQDDIVKLHAQLALQELDAITREFLFPQQILSKNLKILDIT